MTYVPSVSFYSPPFSLFPSDLLNNFTFIFKPWFFHPSPGTPGSRISCLWSRSNAGPFAAFIWFSEWQVVGIKQVKQGSWARESYQAHSIITWVLSLQTTFLMHTHLGKFWAKEWTMLKTSEPDVQLLSGILSQRSSERWVHKAISEQNVSSLEVLWLLRP